MTKLIAIILIALNTNIFAQDPMAKEVMDNLRRTTKSYKNISVDFNLIVENKSQNIKEEKEGTLILSGEKYLLIMDDQTIIDNGETKWIYLSDMNEVQITEHEEDDIMNPNKLFNIYEEDYKYTYVSRDSRNGKYLHIINLFPKESGNFIKINLAIDATKNQLERITINDKNGGTFSYIVKSFKTNTVLKPFTFNINDFPNIEIIDLR